MDLVNCHFKFQDWDCNTKIIRGQHEDSIGDAWCYSIFTCMAPQPHIHELHILMQLLDIGYWARESEMWNLISYILIFLVL